MDHTFLTRMLKEEANEANDAVAHAFAPLHTHQTDDAVSNLRIECPFTLTLGYVPLGVFLAAFAFPDGSIATIPLYLPKVDHQLSVTSSSGLSISEDATDPFS